MNVICRKFSSLIRPACIATALLALSAQAAESPPPQTAPPPAGSLSLPRPDFHFQGNVGRTVEESDPATFPQLVRPPKGAPNVVLILLDDVGFGQFSVFGGGVPAPNMEKLAQQGLRYNRFHTTAVCSPTRAALLTGRDQHVAGMGVITEMAAGYDGYTGIIPKETGTFAEVLRQNGYATAWVGKNHNTPAWETSEAGPFDRWANGLGFDYFYGFNAGDINQWEPILYENRTRVPRSTDPDYHLSADIADHSIAWMQKVKAIDPDRPFFLYVATAATHSPHQAPQEWIDKFKGKFDMGWDAYREQTFERQKRLGVIPQDAKLTPRPKVLPAWSSLNADQKRLYAHMMEVFAAYGAHVDHEMGRVIDAVSKLPDADNTMIIYVVGDNGSSSEGGFEGMVNENFVFNNIPAKWQDNIKVIDELGGPKHFNHFPAEWAWAMDTPFQYVKAVASHFGGTRNPMIISWPKKITDRGGLRSQFLYVTDIAPTILEAAGVQFPDSLNGIAQVPLAGRSFEDTFTDAKAPEHRRMQFFEMFGTRGLYKDGWMLSSVARVPWDAATQGPLDFDSLKWELYNIDQDFSQANDLAAKDPKRVRSLEQIWWAEAARNKALPVDIRGAERMSDQVMGRPSLAAGRKVFTYPTPLAFVPEGSAPDLKNKSFTVTADAEIPAGGAEGVIFTQGGNTGGWGFYIQNNKLVGMHSFVANDFYRAESSTPLPSGKVKLAMDFRYDGGGMGKGGTLTLYVNGAQVGQTHVEKTTPFKYSLSEGQSIGEDAGSPVDQRYTPPFKFTGTLGTVTVELK